jgi:hypothetical protein
MTSGEPLDPEAPSGGDAGAPARPDERSDWQWDGERWQYPEGAGAEVGPEDSPPPAHHDGQWVWDGTQWQPVV